MSAPPWPDRRRTICQPAVTGTPRDDPDATGLTKPPDKNGDTPDEYAAQPTGTKEPHHDGNEEPNHPTAVRHHRRIVDPLRRERGSGRPRPPAEPVVGRRLRNRRSRPRRRSVVSGTETQPARRTAANGSTPTCWPSTSRTPS